MKKGLSGLVLGLVLAVCGLSHAGTVTYVYTDPQGTPLAEADASGNITARFDYAPYGTAVASMSPAPNGPGYTGHVNDPETGLVYMQARYYDPVTAHFLTVDPKAPAPGNTFNFNRYAYANNNPINNIDPDGRQVAPGDDGPIAMWARNGDGSSIPYGASLQATQLAVSNIPEVGDAMNVATAFQNPTAFNIGVAAVGALPVIGAPVVDAIKGASALQRAETIAGTMSKFTQSKVTIAVTETAEGTRVVSSSEGALRPAARAALGEGEVAAQGVAGVHAEVNGNNAARGMGLTPIGTAASRPICPTCAQALRDNNVVPLSPLKHQ